MSEYYYIKTDCLSNTWNTSEIRDFLCELGCFTPKPYGEFFSEIPFLDISLMKVKDVNSWSSFDYDEEETNYISIVKSDDKEESVLEILKKIEQFLGFRLCPDN